MQSIGSVFNTVSGLLNGAIALMVTLAIVVFFWGLVKYLMTASGEADKAKGASLMLWGIIAIAVMLSIYGLIRILQNTFGVGGGQIIQPPQVQTLIYR